MLERAWRSGRKSSDDSDQILGNGPASLPGESGRGVRPHPIHVADDAMEPWVPAYGNGPPCRTNPSLGGGAHEHRRWGSGLYRNRKVFEEASGRSLQREGLQRKGIRQLGERLLPGDCTDEVTRESCLEPSSVVHELTPE